MGRQRDNKGRYIKERVSLYKKCVECKSRFYCRSLFRYETGKYCSLNCQRTGQSALKKGKRPYVMTDAIRQKIKRSKQGISKWNGYRPGMTWMQGSNNYNWKGGITLQDISQRKKFRQKMHQAILKRDNYTCQLCGSNQNLQVDHIQTWADYVELRFKMENCRTLCASCHYQITYGKPMPKSAKAWGHNLLKGGNQP